MTRGVVVALFLAVNFFVLTASQAFPEQAVELRVARGDTLIDFCRQYLEDGTKWREIARINRLKNPDSIYPGQIILVPADMLKGLPMDGSATFVQGEVKVLSARQTEWTPFVAGSIVTEGSRIRTGPDGTAEVVFRTGTTLFLRPDTEIGITSLRDQGAVYYRNLLRLQTGKAIATIRKATGRENRFHITTPSATAAARGTEFRSAVDAHETSRFEVLEGGVEVEANGQTVTAGPNEGTFVRKGEAPTKPRRLLASPELREPLIVRQWLPVHLSFDHERGAAAYRAILARDKEGRQVVQEAILDQKEPFVISSLTDGTYYVQATSIDPDGLEGIPSGWMDVTVRTNPVPPFIEAPVEGHEQKGDRLEMRWMKVRDAAGYRLQVSQTSGFDAPFIDKTGITETAFVIRPPTYGTYAARIRSIASDGYEGKWSDPVTFTLSALPQSPSLDRPSMGKNEIQIRWQDLGQGVTYHIQMSRDEDFRSVLIDRKVSDTHIIVPRPKQPGVYYVRTASIDVKGFEGAFSQPQTFEIKAPSRYGILGIIGAGIAAILLAF